MNNGTTAYSGWLTLRELDTERGLAKGHAFRAFKRLLPQLHEGEDFVVFDHQTQAGMGAELHAADRIYRNSVNPVLLSPATAQRVRVRLEENEKQG